MGGRDWLLAVPAWFPRVRDADGSLDRKTLPQASEAVRCTTAGVGGGEADQIHTHFSENGAPRVVQCGGTPPSPK